MGISAFIIVQGVGYIVPQLGYLIGFGTSGPVAGSIAATAQSYIGASVSPGSAFAICQSVAMTAATSNMYCLTPYLVCFIIGYGAHGIKPFANGITKSADFYLGSAISSGSALASSQQVKDIKEQVAAATSTGVNWVKPPFLIVIGRVGPLADSVTKSTQSYVGPIVAYGRDLTYRQSIEMTAAAVKGMNLATPYIGRLYDPVRPVANNIAASVQPYIGSIYAAAATLSPLKRLYHWTTSQPNVEQSAPPESKVPGSAAPESTPPGSANPESTPPGSAVPESTPKESAATESTSPGSAAPTSAPPESTTASDLHLQTYADPEEEIN